MIESPDPTRADPPQRSRVIPFPTLRWRRRRWLGVTMGPVGGGGLDAGWHLNRTKKFSGTGHLLDISIS
jgi:hypothetical protein